MREKKKGVYQKYLKNLLDRLLALVGTAALSWLLLGVGIAVRLDSPGPVLFRQKRVGRNGQYFYIYKFRTMRIDTPHDMPTHLLNHPDFFITRVGRFLRKTSLDELPQLFNILKGDMALVGPRPALWNQENLISERERYGANSVVRASPAGHRSMGGMNFRSGKKRNWTDIMCITLRSEWTSNASVRQPARYCGRMEFMRE